MVVIFDLPFVGFTKADNVDRVTQWGKHYDMQPIAYVPHSPITTHAAVKSIIFQDQGRRPFEVPHQGKRESTLFNVASVFGWIISNLHDITVSTINYLRQVFRRDDLSGNTFYTLHLRYDSLLCWKTAPKTATAGAPSLTSPPTSRTKPAAIA